MKTRFFIGPEDEDLSEDELDEIAGGGPPPPKGN